MPSERSERLPAFSDNKRRAAYAMGFVALVVLTSSVLAYNIFRTHIAIYRVIVLTERNIETWQQIEKLVTFSPVDRRDGSLNIRMVKRIQEQIRQKLEKSQEIEVEIESVLDSYGYVLALISRGDDHASSSPSIPLEIRSAVTAYANMPAEIVSTGISLWDSDLRIRFTGSKYLSGVRIFSYSIGKLGEKISKYTKILFYITSICSMLFIVYTYVFVINPIFKQMIVQHEKLLYSQEKEFHNEKLRVLGQIAAGVAHEFNNVLAVIAGNAKIGITKIKKNIDPSKHLFRIQESSLRAASLSDQLLVYARKKSLAKENIHMPSFSAGLEQSCRIAAASVHLECSLTSSSTVEADHIYLETSIVNLIANARDALGETASPKIELHIEDIMDNESPYVRISVCDNGPGIPADLVSRIREPFVTARKSGRGTGLGLSLVEGFALQSKGRLDIASRPGRTEFILVLPAIDPSTDAQGDNSETADEETTLDGVRVLFVEDRLDEFDFMIELLESAGCTVYPAATYDEAMALCSKPLDIVVCDVDLGTHTGLDILRLFQGKSYEPPFIFVTGISPNEFVNTQLRKTGQRILQKPFPIETLFDAIGKAAA